VSKASGAPCRDISNIFPVVLTGAEETEDDSALLRALWKERNRSRRPGGSVVKSTSLVSSRPNVVGDSDNVSPFVVCRLFSDCAAEGSSTTGVGCTEADVSGRFVAVEIDGEDVCFGELPGISPLRGNTGTDDCCDALLDAIAVGEVVRAGFPAGDVILDTTLDTLACLTGAAIGGGSGPRPNIEEGVLAATAEAYFSSVAGRVGWDAGFGTPFVVVAGGAVAAVDVTMGRAAATLDRRFGADSLAFGGGSSF